MAAKVAMVAVPTVLGVASIRVYRAGGAPRGDGLLVRELQIYTPLTQPTQFVAEKPGALECGLGNLRESLWPFVQAVQGACVSLKRGGINLYHAGEDAYYYLKDPPAGFLPRLGTVTMAGMLGMILAQKGSRFRRLVLPLSMMSASASVCYPAQAVAVLKVSGRKLYAAGKWSSASVSSLFASKPKELTLPPVQSDTVPNPESLAAEDQSAAPCHDSSAATDIPAQSDAPAESSSVVEPASLALTEEPTEPPPPQAPAQVPAEPTTGNATVESVPVESTPEEPPVSKPADHTADTDVESESAPIFGEALDQEPSAQQAPPGNTTEDPVACEAAETAAPTHTPPPPSEQAPTETAAGGAGFKADPALMDFGQSNPEDEDLYSTRS